jgi:hypothetical protein
MRDEERVLLPLVCSSLSSSTFTLLSLADGTAEVALLLPGFCSSRSLDGIFGLGATGLSAAILSRSSMASVSFRLFCLSRDLPVVVAREAELSVSADRSADRMLSCSHISLPRSDFSSVSMSSLSFMFSRRYWSSSLSMRDDGESPRAVNCQFHPSVLDSELTYPSSLLGIEVENLSLNFIGL